MILRSLSFCFLLFCVLLLTFSCNTKPEKPKEIPLTIKGDSLSDLEQALEIRKSINAVLADGLELSLWASDSLAPDPISMDIDDRGRIYITRTNRQKNSEFDIRGHRDWITASITLQSVEDRRNFLHKTFATELSNENTWLKDLNNDSISDWRDLTVEKDEIWMLEDTDNDGLADISTRILSDFNNEVTDVAGAILVKEDAIYLGISPDMWKLTDTNGDAILDEKTSLVTGFGVHIGFSGHGMSGAIEGPDGKIYWGIGDVGANLTDLEGNNHKYPNQGVIVRCNPDGSDFEIFAHGLRNTHEFVFDAYGNIITSDNDGDHAGEEERLVYVVDGSDAGWRTNWQFGKYTDPKNNTYKVWTDELLFKPRWEGQAAYIMPPLANFHAGPTGMAYNPGTALGQEWLNSFYLVQFSGAPNRSHVWNFTLKPKGASFELDKDVSILNGILVTDLQFGPDGALYMSDWINGWGTKNYGRVWKLDVEETKNNLREARLLTRKLMTLDYKEASTDSLAALLTYDDMRIRKKAQFELVKRGASGYKVLKNVVSENPNQFARIHAIWGIGQIANDETKKAAPLVAFLSDDDPEIIAQTLKVLGDVKYSKAGTQLISSLSHENARVRFFAAQALGRTQQKDAIQPLLNMLASNNDEDVYLRHAAVLALSRIGNPEPIVALANNPNKSLRLAAVLVLRKLQDSRIASFLNDEDPYIVTEVARAINDDWSIEGALPALANLLASNKFTDSEPLLRRSINAALRVGGDKELDNLIAFAKRDDVSSILRREALATIATWTSPSVLDRVDGRFRGEIQRDNNLVKSKLIKHIPSFLENNDPYILVGIVDVLKMNNIENFNDQLFEIFKVHKSTEVKSEILQALGELNFKNIETAVQLGLKNQEQQLRSTAIGLIQKLNISKEKLPSVVLPIFKYGTISDQQKMLNTLGELPYENTEIILKNLTLKAKNKQLPKGIMLDLMEAVEKSKSKTLITELNELKGNSDSMESYKDALFGGDAKNGARVFNHNSTAQCVRCHAINNAGGKVGPELDHIASTLTREQILEALVEPSARLAPGFGSVIVTLKDGQVITGVLEKETPHDLILKTSEAEPMEIPIARIKRRENMVSSMPPMGKLINKRELRDLIAYLSTLK